MQASETPTINSQDQGVLAALPRRRLLDVTSGEVALSQIRSTSFHTKRILSVDRFLTWLQVLINFLILTLIDILIRKDSTERRAVRLRRAFEREGGSFIKLGLYLSMRMDFMPWVYCIELSRLADRMQPFPLSQAVAIIERSTGLPLASTFAQFDPDPILASSVANTYQAELLSGHNVVVKVRRPGVGEQFMADIQAFNWLLSIAEFLTIFRPGFTRGIRSEFRNLLMEELDFVQEARKQDGFRRAARKTRRDYFSAPCVHLDLSSEEVVISDFASGMWMWELLSALEHKNENLLARAREMNIDPKRVAKRLLWVNNWSWEEHLFFHAEPNPYNIIIGRDSTLYFINFSATGTLSRSKRQAFHQNLYYAGERDPQNMARASLVLLEPLPHIDLIELTQELESYNWELVYAQEAAPKSLPWQERTSVVQWIGVMRLASKYRIVMDIEVLRMLHATLLVEAIAVRLHPKIDFVKQYWKFNHFRAEKARRKVTRTLQDQLEGKQNERLIIRIDRFLQTAGTYLMRQRHSLSFPSVNFNSLMGKWPFAIYILFRFIGQAAMITALAAIAVEAIHYIQNQQLANFLEVLGRITANPLYLVILFLLVVVSGRTVLFRMDDKETDHDQSG